MARGTSFLKESLDKKIFPENVTIIDDPLRRRGIASRPFDAEGVKTKEIYLVEKGILQSWILDLRSAAQLGMQTTGHASRGLASPPSPVPGNLYVAPGKNTPEELIKGIKKGFYVTETFGMGVNLITGDYSQGASGFLIENGAITTPVAGITIASRLHDMFAGMVAGNDLEFRYSINTPTIFIENMTIAGK